MGSRVVLDEGSLALKAIEGRMTLETAEEGTLIKLRKNKPISSDFFAK